MVKPEYNNAYGCIIRASCSLPKELCHLAGSFLRMSDEDRIKYMLANRDEPNIFIASVIVIEELDDVFIIDYWHACDTWSHMSVIDRIISLNARTFRVTFKFPRLSVSCDLEHETLRTEYTLRSILADMQCCDKRYSAAGFDWQNIFSSSLHGYIGDQLRALWSPQGLELELSQGPARDDCFSKIQASASHICPKQSKK